jgi:hypothetical protein
MVTDLTIKLFKFYYMSFTQGIQIINALVADQTVASSVTPVDIGVTGTGNTIFSRSLVAGSRIQWELEGVFALGATGGFRLLAHSTAAPTTYNATFQVVDETTPATFQDTQITEAAFTNASAVAGNYILKAFGTIIANAATVFSLQFAQNNSQVTGMVMQKGMTFKIWQF